MFDIFVAYLCHLWQVQTKQTVLTEQRAACTIQSIKMSVTDRSLWSFRYKSASIRHVKATGHRSCTPDRHFVFCTCSVGKGLNIFDDCSFSCATETARRPLTVSTENQTGVLFLTLDCGLSSPSWCRKNKECSFVSVHKAILFLLLLLLWNFLVLTFPESMTNFFQSYLKTKTFTIYLTSKCVFL